MSTDVVVVAAVAAAVAAFFSATAAVMILFEMRAARILSVRPEIHLVEWEYEPKTGTNPDRGRIKVNKIANHGPGSARGIFFRLESPRTLPVGQRPFWSGPTIGLLAAGAESELKDGIGTFSWRSSTLSGGLTPDGEEAKMAALKLTCTCWDAIGNRYQAFFQLLAYNFEASSGNTHMLTPGLHLFHRTEKRQAVWRLKLKQWYDRMKVVPPQA